MTNQSVKWLTIREIYSSAATLMELFYCSQVEYLTIIVICFFCGDLSVASVTLIGIRYTETVSELQQQHYFLRLSCIALWTLISTCSTVHWTSASPERDSCWRSRQFSVVHRRRPPLPRRPRTVPSTEAPWATMTATTPRRDPSSPASSAEHVHHTNLSTAIKKH